MKKNRKIILCISLLCIFILLVTYSCWFFFYPYRVLGLENDARYYSNHVASKLTGIEEESMSVLDLFVDIVVDGKQYRGIMPGHGKTKFESPFASRYSDKKKNAGIENLETRIFIESARRDSNTRSPLRSGRPNSDVPWTS